MSCCSGVINPDFCCDGTVDGATIIFPCAVNSNVTDAMNRYIATIIKTGDDTISVLIGPPANPIANADYGTSIKGEGDFLFSFLRSSSNISNKCPQNCIRPGECDNICENQITFQLNDNGFNFNYTIRYNLNTSVVEGGCLSFEPTRIVRSAIPPTFAQNKKQQLQTPPIVIIGAEGNPDRTEVISITITITDFYKYTLCRYCLEKEYVGELVDSSIIIYHPDFYKVIKGECGCNLRDKIVNLLESDCVETTSNPTVNDIVGYAVVLYSLSALVYGCFDLDHLRCTKFDDFVEDLEESRFSVFTTLFTDPQYGFKELHKFFVC